MCVLDIMRKVLKYEIKLAFCSFDSFLNMYELGLCIKIRPICWFHASMLITMFSQVRDGRNSELNAQKASALTSIER